MNILSCRNIYLMLFLILHNLIRIRLSADAYIFTREFAKVFIRSSKTSGLSDIEELRKSLAELIEKRDSSLNDLFDCLSSLCASSPRPIVLMIDEVDSASNNQVFVEFLALLRKYYLNRDDTPSG